MLSLVQFKAAARALMAASKMTYCQALDALAIPHGFRTYAAYRASLRHHEKQHPPGLILMSGPTGAARHADLGHAEDDSSSTAAAALDRIEARLERMDQEIALAAPDDDGCFQILCKGSIGDVFVPDLADIVRTLDDPHAQFVLTDSSMWKGRAVSMIGAVMDAALWRQLAMGLPSGGDELWDMVVDLNRMVDLADQASYPDMPERLRDAVAAELDAIGYFEAVSQADPAMMKDAVRQHGYMVHYFMPLWRAVRRRILLHTVETAVRNRDRLTPSDRPGPENGRPTILTISDPVEFVDPDGPARRAHQIAGMRTAAIDAFMAGLRPFTVGADAVSPDPDSATLGSASAEAFTQRHGDGPVERRAEHVGNLKAMEIDARVDAEAGSLRSLMEWAILYKVWQEEALALNPDAFLCGCMGPINGAPLCPCRMRRTIKVAGSVLASVEIDERGAIVLRPFADGDVIYESSASLTLVKTAGGYGLLRDDR